MRWTCSTSWGDGSFQGSPGRVPLPAIRPCRYSGRRFVAFQEGPDVVERPNPFGAECHDHAHVICSHPGSCSLPVGNRLSAHAHFSLDNAQLRVAAFRGGRGTFVHLTETLPGPGGGELNPIRRIDQ